MFYYFGSKERLASHYPEPVHEIIVEPFAGSAGYSRLHWRRDVTLIERDERVVELWSRLRRMTPEEVTKLPTPIVGERSSDLLVMLRAASEHSLTGEYITVTERMVSRWEALKTKIMENLPRVQHWKIVCADYRDAPDIRATWFVDPPYRGLERGYAHRPDYDELARWCRRRRGQTIVCERLGADWLPFRPLRSHLATNNVWKTEVVWTRKTRR